MRRESRRAAAARSFACKERINCAMRASSARGMAAVLVSVMMGMLDPGRGRTGPRRAATCGAGVGEDAAAAPRDAASQMAAAAMRRAERAPLLGKTLIGSILAEIRKTCK